MKNPWKVGDEVRFAHEPEGTKRKVTKIVEDHLLGTFLEVDGMVGQFAYYIFVAPDHPADSIVPRPRIRK